MQILNYLPKKSIAPYLQKKMDQAINGLEKLGAPSTKLEEFKKTNLKLVFEKTYKKTNRPTLNTLNALYTATKQEHSQTVVINGEIEKSVSHDQLIRNKIVLMTLSEAMTEHADDFSEIFNQDQKETYLNLFSQVALEKGIFIKIPKKQTVDFYSLLNIASSDDESSFNNQATFIVLEEQSELNLEETYKTFFNNQYLNFNQTYIYLRKGSRLNHVRISNENQTTTHLGNINVYVERDAHYNSVTLNLGNELTRIDLNVYLKEENAKTKVSGLLALKDQDHCDIHTFISHEKPHTESEQCYKSILDGSAHGVFVGGIHIAQHAQKVQSSQLSKTLLLSKNAHIDTEPQLFIYADDVKAGHGAAIGNLSDDQVFYFQSRGISEEKAKTMLSHAFANDVFMKIENSLMESRINKVFFEIFGKEVL